MSARGDGCPGDERRDLDLDLELVGAGQPVSYNCQVSVVAGCQQQHRPGIPRSRAVDCLRFDNCATRTIRVYNNSVVASEVQKMYKYLQKYLGTLLFASRPDDHDKAAGY